MKKFIALLTLVLAFAYTSKASHISGGDITYTYIGNDQYVIQMNLYYDCTSTLNMGATQNVTLESASCGQTVNLTLDIVLNPLTGDNFTDISQLCDQEIPNSTCNGGNLPGMQMYTYVDTITFPAACTDWVASWSTCCRNPTENVPTSTSDDVYLLGLFNNLDYPGNSSPTFTTNPLPYLCNGQAYSMDMLGVAEPDGDSIVYQFISAMENNAVPLVYGPGYSANQPITGITIDPQTGLIDVTPGLNGNFIVTISVVEYDANGNIMSSIMRDIQMVVINCQNEPVEPLDPANPVTNFQSATGNLVGPTAVEICEGQQFCFDIVMTDPDGDSIVIDTNGLSVVTPGYTATQTGVNPVTLTYCWTPPAGSPSYVGLPLSIEDDQCPIPSIPYNLLIDITIFDAVVTGPDQIICNNQGAQLTAGGGSTFNWSILPGGDPIVVGNNFSCNPCANPIATPAITTTYVVTGNLPAGCTQTDTVTVTVAPDYTFSTSQTGGVTCLADTIDVTTTVNPILPGYTYSWSLDPVTGGTFVNPAIQDPSFIPSSPGTYDIIAQITSPEGCVDYDTSQLVVNPGFAPDFTLLTQDDTIDCGEITDIEVNLNSSIPAFCQTSPLVCGATLDADIGANNVSGVNSNTSWPAPYGNWYANAKHQFLFTAAELNAMGFLGGKISEISWETLAQTTATADFFGYTIWIGCTSTNNLTDWEPVAGLNQVFGPTDITVTLGWNTHQFNQGFDWDGVSNIVVQICYDNIAQGYTRNWETPYTTTAFASTLYYRSDFNPACPELQSTSTNDRPVTRFGYCAGDPDPSNYTFTYNPNATTVIQPDSVEVDPCVTTTYTVTVTDNTSGCTDSATITIVVDDPQCAPPLITMDSVQCFGDATGMIYAEAVGQDGPWTFEWRDSSNTLLQTTNNVDFDTLQNVTTGWYYVTTTDQNACSEMDSIFVGEPPLLTMTVTADSTICIGDDVTVGVSATGGSPNYTYNWNQGLASDTSHVVTPASDTCYVVTVTDDNGCTTAADSICITLNPPLSATLSPYDSICPGSTSTITAVAAGGSGMGYDYQWIDSDGNTYAGDSFVVNPTSQITWFYLTLTDDCTTPQYLDSTMVILQPYVADLTTLDPSCGGSNDGVATVVITGTSGPYTLNWVQDPNTTPVIVETDNNVATTDSVTILTAGDYELQITDQGGCQVDTSFTIGEPTPVVITVGPGSTICLTDPATVSATASGGTGPYTLTWGQGLIGDGPHTVTPLVDTWYPVFATDANGCTSPSDSILIQLNPPLSGTALTDGTICPGADYSQTVTASGGSGTGYAYNWTASDGSTFTGSSITVTPTDLITDYYLEITDDCGTPAHLDTFTVSLSALPGITFTGTNLEGCYPITSQFSANVPNAVSYNWIFGDGNTTGFGQNNTVTNDYIGPGCYDVTLQIQTANGCQVDTTYSQYVCAWDFPVASFIASPQVTTTEFTNIQFTNTSDDNSTNLWNFANLGASVDENPEFTFPDEEEGQYPVTLTVTNDYGCVDTTMLIVTVEQEVQFFIPNTFTPDGDEFNQTWQIHGYGFDPNDFNVKIFDRWGEIVWESNNADISWDGVYRGQLLPDGVYVFRIQTKRLRDDSKVERTGHVTIMR